jgi:hypothetical protein
MYRVLTNSGLGSEYDYLRGPVLQRLIGNLTLSNAKDYQAALGEVRVTCRSGPQPSGGYGL